MIKHVQTMEELKAEINKGDVLCVAHTNKNVDISDALEQIKGAYKFSSVPVETHPVVREIIR